MPIAVSAPLISRLASLGVTCRTSAGAQWPDELQLEPPCSLKWMQVHHSLHLGAFSYAVSGYYFACRIGRYCSFGEEVQIGRHPHPMNWVSTSPFFYQQYPGILDQALPEGVEMNPHKDFPHTTPSTRARLTTLGNDVWIGHGAFILPGVTIGDGAVIAARSVVTRDVPPYAVVAGAPAQVKRMRFDADTVARLLASRWWEFAPWQLRGLCVDDLPVFLAGVSALREQGVEPWSPERVKVADVAKEMAQIAPAVAPSVATPPPPHSKPTFWRRLRARLQQR